MGRASVLEVEFWNLYTWQSIGNVFFLKFFLLFFISFQMPRTCHVWNYKSQNSSPLNLMEFCVMGILELGSPLRIWCYCLQQFEMIQNWHPIQWFCEVCYPSARIFTPSHSPFLGVWSPLGVILCPCASNVNAFAKLFREVAGRPHARARSVCEFLRACFIFPGVRSHFLLQLPAVISTQ